MPFNFNEEGQKKSLSDILGQNLWEKRGVKKSAEIQGGKGNEGAGQKKYPSPRQKYKTGNHGKQGRSRRSAKEKSKKERKQNNTVCEKFKVRRDY